MDNWLQSGLALIGAGGGLTLLVRGLTRQGPPENAFPGSSLAGGGGEEGASPALSGEGRSDEGVISVAAGGRVTQINARAREWFKLGNARPNLEKMARQVRPVEDFLRLCATPGRANLRLHGRLVEAVSYAAGDGLVVLTLRRPISLAAGAPYAAPGELQAEFTRAATRIAASLDLPDTLRAVLDSVARLSPADSILIHLNEDMQSTGDGQRPDGQRPDGQRPDGQRPDGQRPDGQRPSGRRAYRLEDGRLASPSTPPEGGYATQLNLPLQAGETSLGSLDLAWLNPNACSPTEAKVLQALANQAAAALHHALLFRREQQRSRELAGLANLAQTAGEFLETQELYARLVETGAALLEVDVFGFLIYDESRRRLAAQAPFQGIPAELVDWYEISLDLPGWDAPALIVAESPEDPHLEALGLHHMALMAGLRQTALCPLLGAMASGSGGCLGYLQIGNKRDGRPFDSHDLELLHVLAGQAAPILENAALVQQARRRTQRAESLRRIASLSGSGAGLDDILKYSLQDLARLLQSDLGLIYLYADEQDGSARLHLPSVFASPQIDLAAADGVGDSGRRSSHAADGVGDSGRRSLADGLPQRAPAGQGACAGGRPFSSGDLLRAAPLPALLRELAETHKLRSLAAAPLLRQGRPVGELLLGSLRPDFFQPGDLDSAVTVAGQLAGAIERDALATQSDESLRRRVEQLSAMARLSRELNASFDLEHLLQLVYTEALRLAGAECGEIVLFGEEPNPPAPFPLREGGAESPSPDGGVTGDGRTPATGVADSVLIRLGEGGQAFPARWQGLLARGAAGGALSLAPAPGEAHPGVRGVLLCPIVFQERVAGLIELHTARQGGFDPEDCQVVEMLSVQAAAAIGSAQRFQQAVQRGAGLQRRVDTLAELSRLLPSLPGELPLPAALELLAEAMQAAVGFDVALISRYDPATGCLARAAQVGLSAAQWAELRAHTPAWSAVQDVLRPEFRLGQVYFVPEEQAPLIPAEVHTLTALPLAVTPPAGDAWRAEDMLLAPLLSPQGEPLGLISLDCPRNGRRPDRPALETLEVFAGLAALVIAAGTQRQALAERAAGLDGQLAQTHQAAAAAQAQAAEAQQVLAQQSAALAEAEQSGARWLAALEIGALLTVVPHASGMPVDLHAGGVRYGTPADPQAKAYGTGAPDEARPKPYTAGAPAAVKHTGQLPPLPGQPAPGSNGDSQAKAYGTGAAPAAVKHTGQLPPLPGQPAPGSNGDSQAKAYGTGAAADSQAKAYGTGTGSLQESSALLRRVAAALCIRMGFSAALAVEPAAGGLRLAGAAGDVPAGIEAYFGQRSPLRHALSTGEALWISDLAADAEWQGAGLLAALNARACVCLPVMVEERPRAALLAVSARPLAGFGEADRQVGDQLARQVGAALANLDAMAEAARRAREVDRLLAFSRELGGLDPQRAVEALLDTALRLAPAAQSGLAAMFEPSSGRLVVRAARGYADSAALLGLAYLPGEGLPGQAFATGQPARVDEVDFARHYNLSAANLQILRAATRGRLPVAALVVPILAATQERPLGVLVLDTIDAHQPFSPADLGVALSLAEQTGLNLENARLYASAQQRAGMMEALARASSVLSASLEGERLVAGLLDQLQAVAPFDTGVIWLRTPSGNRLEVRAERGFPPGEERAGLSVAVEDSALLAAMLHSGEAIMVADVRQDGRFSGLVEYERLAWLGIPLAAAGGVLGVIALEKAEPGFYTPEMVQAAATFAGQAAAALENARLYQESVQRAADLEQRSQNLAMLNRLSSELGETQAVEQALQVGVRHVTAELSCSGAAAILFDGQDLNLDAAAPRMGGAVLAGEYPPASTASEPSAPARAGKYPLASTTPDPAGSSLPDSPLYERLRQSGGVFQSEDAQHEPELRGLDDFLRARQAHSLLALPLLYGSAASGQLSGLLLAYDRGARRFEPELVELARTIANQTSSAVERARLLDETRSLSADLEERVEERTAELAREHQRSETLVRILSELSASLDLEQVLARTLVVLQEAIPAAAISLLARRNGRWTRLAALNDPALPPGEQALAEQVAAACRPLLIDSAKTGGAETGGVQSGGAENGGVQSDGVQSDGAGGANDAAGAAALGAPLMNGAEAAGALLLFAGRQGAFTPEQADLAQAAANQIAVALNQAELFNLVRDQAEDVGRLLRSAQIEASRSQAILEAVADGVLVTDAARRVTLFNGAAEQIFGWQRSQVLGQSLEQFGGMFGPAAQEWMEAIQSWSSPKAAGASPNEATYAQRIELPGGRVLQVHLAPVSLRSDFLGTVSIFSDVTHQVEVDRLKSEFVATVSHELRTPLTSIKGYVEVLLMGMAGGLSEQQRGFLAVVQNNTERLSALVNDLLDISRIEAGRQSLLLQPLALGQLTALFEQARAELLRRAAEDGHALEVTLDLPPDLPQVWADPQRVRQILDNLLDNAYVYNIWPEPGTPVAPRIVLRASARDGQVQIDVQDSGQGIPPGEQGRVFERFFRGEGPLLLGVPGAGLGLSIVQNLVEMHQGRIWLESAGQAGQGSTFSFTLPIFLEGA